MIHSLARPICLNTHSLESVFQWTHSLEWSIHSNDPFVKDPMLNDPSTWPTHLNDPYTNDPFTWVTHSLKWPPFTWMTHSLKWPIQLKIVLSTSSFFKYIKLDLEFYFKKVSKWNDPFANDPFTQMTHSLQWPIHLKVSFSRPIHLNDPFTWMTHSLEWPIHLKASFSRPIHLKDPFTWMTHSLKWPIHVNDPFSSI